MRCYCCNEQLTSVESKIKWKDTGEYADTCLVCLQSIDRKVRVPYQNEDDWFDEWELKEDPEEDILDMHEDDYWDER